MKKMPMKKMPMKKMIAVIAATVGLAFGLGLAAAPVSAQSGERLPIGADVTLRNTLQDPGEPETAFPSLFGLPEDAYDESGTVSTSGSEFPTALAQPDTPLGDISGLYDIDMTADSIRFTMLPTVDDPFWANVFGDFPAGKFDRYYFTFSEPHNVTGGSSSDGTVALRVDSPTVLVVEIGEGYDMNPPQSFEIALQGFELAVTGTEPGVLAAIAAMMIVTGAVLVSRARRLDH